MSIAETHEPTRRYHEYIFKNDGQIIFSIYVNCDKVTIDIFFVEFKKLVEQRKTEMTKRCFISFVNKNKPGFKAFASVSEIFKSKRNDN